MSKTKKSKLAWVIRKGRVPDKYGSFDYWCASADEWRAQYCATPYTTAHKKLVGKLPPDGVWVRIHVPIEPPATPAPKPRGNPGKLTRALAEPGECAVCWAKLAPHNFGHCDRCMRIYCAELLAASEGPAVPRAWVAVLSTDERVEFASCAIDGGDWVILHGVEGIAGAKVNASVRLEHIVVVYANPNVKKGRK